MDRDRIARPAPRPVESEAASAERQMRMLRELVDMGMSIARRMRDQAATHPDPAALAKSFVQIADGVRRNIALEASIAEDCRKRSVQAPAPTPMRTNSVDRAQQELSRRYAERVRAAVRAAIVADSEPGDVAPRYARLDDCLRHPQIRQELTQRPLAEIAGTICRALRVRVDPSLFAQLAPARKAIAAPTRQEAPQQQGQGPASFNEVSSLPPHTRTVHKPS